MVIVKSPLEGDLGQEKQTVGLSRKVGSQNQLFDVHEHSSRFTIAS